jgi:hypothetical protein
MPSDFAGMTDRDAAVPWSIATRAHDPQAYDPRALVGKEQIQCGRSWPSAC